MKLTSQFVHCTAYVSLQILISLSHQEQTPTATGWKKIELQQA